MGKQGLQGRPMREEMAQRPVPVIVEPVIQEKQKSISVPNSQIEQTINSMIAKGWYFRAHICTGTNENLLVFERS